MRRLPIALSAALLVLLSALGGSGAAAQQEGVLVRVDPVKRTPLVQTVPVLGRLVARRGGVITARVAGPLASLEVEVGDRVEEDEIIATLNAELLTARRDLAKSRLGEARAERDTQSAELGLARLAYKRLEALKKSAAFSQARFEDARQSVAIAEAKLKEASAKIVSAETDLALAEINLADANIRASYGGVITERLTEAGDYVQAGGAIVRMLGDRDLEVEADVPFQNLTGVRPGTKLAITLDDGTRHEAVVRAIIPAENPLTRTRAVRLSPVFSATLSPLAHEQSVTLDVPVGASREVLSVHKDAVIPRGGGTIVFVAGEEGAELRPVALGIEVGNRFEVLDGLQEGEAVVVRGNERLRPGTKVRVEGAT